MLARPSPVLVPRTTKTVTPYITPVLPTRSLTSVNPRNCTFLYITICITVACLTLIVTLLQLTTTRSLVLGSPTNLAVQSPQSSSASSYTQYQQPYNKLRVIQSHIDQQQQQSPPPQQQPAGIKPTQFTYQQGRNNNVVNAAIKGPKLKPLTPQEIYEKPMYLSFSEYQYLLHDKSQFETYSTYTPGEPIDLVYTWVNGSDPVYRQQRAIVAAGVGNVAADAKSEKRIRSSRNELLYSLRSVEKHMPWINNVYIVTSGQTPNWLDTSNPRVKVLTLDDIYTDKRHLPSYNSASIETQIHNIPGLSEHYIYMNDDYILFDEWTVNDFITPKKEYVVYYSQHQFAQCRRGINCRPSDTVAGQLMYTDRLMYEKHSARTRYMTAHAPVILSKKLVTAVSESFSLQWQDTASHQFRQFDELQTYSLYNWYLMDSKVAYTLGDKKRTSLYQMSDDNANRMIRELNEWVANGARSICLNDDLKSDAAVRRADVELVEWLNKMLPSKSMFEK